MTQRTDLIGRLKPYREPAVVIAIIVAVICGCILVIDVTDRLDDLAQEFTGKTGVLDRPFGAWSFSYIGNVLMELFAVAVWAVRIVVSNHPIVFSAMVVLAAIGWALNASGKTK